MMENARPFFSVCVPVYNVQEYLKDCLDSLVCQSFSDFEIILVDDGSSDLSGELCDKFKESYAGQCTVIHKKNGGLLMARRTAIQSSKGQFLMFLDSDDMYRADTLEIVHQRITTFSADLVIFNAATDIEYSVPFHTVPIVADCVFEGAEKRLVFETVSSSSLLNNMCMKAVSREIVDVDRDYSPLSHIKMGEDLVQSLPLIDKAERVVYCDELLYFYRMNPASISHVFNPKSFFLQIDVMKELFRYAESWDALGINTKSYIELAHTVGADVCADSIMSVLLSAGSWDEKKSIIDEIKTSELFTLCANAYSKKVTKRSFVMFCVKRNHIRLLRLLVCTKKCINKVKQDKM